MTLKDAIARWPRPIENMTALAHELGCSCGYVRRVAEELGIEHRTRSRNGQRITVRCAGCGKTLKRQLHKAKNKQHFCEVHCPGRRVEVTCLLCGKKRRIQPSGLKHYNSGATREFCDRRCFYLARSLALREWKARRLAEMAKER